MDLYANNPELSKMIHWQALEEKDAEKKELKTSPHSKIMLPWLSIVQDFQKRNMIKQDLDPALVLMMLTQSASCHTSQHLILLVRKKMLVREKNIRKC